MAATKINRKLIFSHKPFKGSQLFINNHPLQSQEIQTIDVNNQHLSICKAEGSLACCYYLQPLHQN